MPPPGDAGAPDAGDGGPPAPATPTEPQTAVVECAKEPKDVIIVQKFASTTPDKSNIPSEQYTAYYWQLAVWAEQWVKADSKHRAIVKVPQSADLTSLRNNTRAKYQEAAGLANGGEIIHALGHGHGDDKDAAYDLGSQTGGYSTHILKMDSAVLAFHIQDRMAQGMGMVPNDVDGKPMSKDKIAKRQEEYAYYVSLNRALHVCTAPKQLVILACTVAKHAGFLFGVAQVLNVPVAGYEDYVGILGPTPVPLVLGIRVPGTGLGFKHSLQLKPGTGSDHEIPRGSYLKTGTPSPFGSP